MNTVSSWYYNQNSLVRYGIPLLFTVGVIQIFYFVQVTYVYPDAEYWSVTIVVPLFVGSLLGLLFGRLFDQALIIKRNEGIQSSLSKQKVLNLILMESTKPQNIEEFLESITDTILSSEELKFEEKIGFFLKDDDEKYRLKVHSNLPEQLLSICGVTGIEPGECLCGLAIASRKPVHCDSVDHQHTISYDGMPNHGHYNIPIAIANKVFGAMVLYLPVGHAYNKDEVDFLESIASIIAMVIQSKMNEDHIKELIKSLEVQNTELLKRNEELDRFVYSTSHDLRSPLLSMMGLIHLLRDTRISDDERNQVFNRLESAVKQSDETISDILDYSKNRRVEVSYEQLEVLDIINEILLSHGYSPEVNNNFEIDVDPGVFVSDHFRIKTIISNLISNAIKYRRKEIPLKVDVTFSLNTDKAILEVSDNGEGIRNDEIKNIFKMFYRLSTSASGSGLGLYITKETVDKLGGNIMIESEIGIGSRFLVIIPNRA